MATEWIWGIVVATLLILGEVVATLWIFGRVENTGWMAEIPDSVWNIWWFYRKKIR